MEWIVNVGRKMKTNYVLWLKFVRHLKTKHNYFSSWPKTIFSCYLSNDLSNQALQISVGYVCRWDIAFNNHRSPALSKHLLLTNTRCDTPKVFTSIKQIMTAIFN